MKKIEDILAEFAPVTLEEMDSVALLDRVDTKYLASASQLDIFLNEVKKEYRVLEIKSLRTSPYRTLYFDSVDFDFYNTHHRGKLNRMKIRCREYLNSDKRFLEIKLKNNKGRTIKKRTKLERFEFDLSDSSLNYIQKVTKRNLELVPTLENRFHRITLVSLEHGERLTIDLGLQFKVEGQNISLPGLIVFELKQNRGSRNSAASIALKKIGIRALRISKYCIGSALLRPELKRNRFKEKLRIIDKLIKA